MSGRLIVPDPETKRRWGPLAHVTESERQRILALPPGQSKYAIIQLEREIEAYHKRHGGRR